MVRRSPLRGDCTAVLAPGSCRVTHFAPCGRCVRTDAASMFTKRAARADPGTAFLVAAQIAPAGCRLPRGWRGSVRGSPFLSSATSASAKPVRGRSRCACGAPRSAAARARARQRATWSDSAHLSERSAHRARSELCAGALAASTAGLSAQPTAAPKRRGLSRTGFAATGSRALDEPCASVSRRDSLCCFNGFERECGRTLRATIRLPSQARLPAPAGRPRLLTPTEN